MSATTPLLPQTEHPVPKKYKGTKSRYLVIAGSFLFVFLILGFSVNVKAEPIPRQPKRNIIFMVSDGMGPASLSLTRSFRQFRDQLSIDDILALDQHLIGSSRTRSSSSLVTDSAAGATAFSCAMKSYNGAIGVDPSKNPCGTILEALKLKGYLTGLVVTTRITDATPAAFSSHVDYRFQEDLIAEHQLGYYELGRMVDLMIGGGRCHYLPVSKGGCRADKRNLIDEAVEDGWTYAGDRASFDLLQGGENVSLPLLSLLAPYDIPYDLDRLPEEYPSLEESAKTALNALSKATEDSEHGFFLLIEGSRIDHAGHSNDPAAQVREVLAYDRAFQAAIDFADSTDVETIIISTSDHETGGLAVAKQVAPSYPDYLWYPEVLLNATHSGEFIARKLKGIHSLNETELEQTIIDVLEKDLGILDYTESDVAELLAKRDNSEYVTNELISKRSQTGWSTHGHSAVDVNIYAYGNSRELKFELLEKLGGNRENIEMGQFMADWLEVDLGYVTDLVKHVKHHPTLSLKSNIEQQQQQVIDEDLDIDEVHKVQVDVDGEF